MNIKIYPNGVRIDIMWIYIESIVAFNRKN